jgi:hypothetical protein
MADTLAEVKYKVAVANRVLWALGLATGATASLGHASPRLRAAAGGRRVAVLHRRGIEGPLAAGTCSTPTGAAPYRAGLCV